MTCQKIGIIWYNIQRPIMIFGQSIESGPVIRAQLWKVCEDLLRLKIIGPDVFTHSLDNIRVKMVIFIKGGTIWQIRRKFLLGRWPAFCLQQWFQVLFLWMCLLFMEQKHKSSQTERQAKRISHHLTRMQWMMLLRQQTFHPAVR